LDFRPAGRGRSTIRDALNVAGRPRPQRQSFLIELREVGTGRRRRRRSNTTMVSGYDASLLVQPSSLGIVTRTRSRELEYRRRAAGTDNAESSRRRSLNRLTPARNYESDDPPWMERGRVEPIAQPRRPSQFITERMPDDTFVTLSDWLCQVEVTPVTR
jgi:hypothetical protein